MLSAFRDGREGAPGFEMDESARDRLKEVLDGAAALIFGLDGVLVSTDRLKYESYLRAVDPLGAELSFEFYRTLIGRSRLETCKAIIEHCGLDIEPQELADLREAERPAVFAEFGMDVIGPARKLLAVLPAGKYKLGLVSSSTRDRVEAGLEALDFDFDSVVSIEGLQAKPEPDLYIKCLQELGVAAADAAAFDDAENGVLAARAAGCRPVAVPTEATGGQDFSAAAVVIDSLWAAGEFLV